MDIILYLLHFIQYQHKQICWLLNFICRYIPLKQWAFDDSHSPKYQKFKIDELPLIIDFKQEWTYKYPGRLLLPTLWRSPYLSLQEQWIPRSSFMQGL